MRLKAKLFRKLKFIFQRRELTTFTLLEAVAVANGSLNNVESNDVVATGSDAAAIIEDKSFPFVGGPTDAVVDDKILAKSPRPPIPPPVFNTKALFIFALEAVVIVVDDISKPSKSRKSLLFDVVSLALSVFFF